MGSRPGACKIENSSELISLIVFISVRVMYIVHLHGSTSIISK